MQRRRLLLLALAGSVWASVLVGCGGSSDDDGSSASTAPAPAASTTTAAPAAATDAGAGGESAVHLKLLSFTPDTLEVAAGTTVEWVDDNPIAHTITSGTYEVGDDRLRTSETPDGAFDGKVATTGDSFSFTFGEPGTYTYYCSIHKGMNATVVVTS